MAGQEQREHGLGSAEAAQEGLKWNLYDLDFSVHKSRRYHEKLSTFYGVWSGAVKIVTLISGSGLWFLLFAGAQHTAEWLAAFIAVWAAVDYMVAPDKKAAKHRDLCEEFTDLAKKIVTAPRTDEAYRNLVAERLDLEKQITGCKRLIDLQARNEECRARGFPPEDIVPLSKPQRVIGYIFTYGMPRLEEWKAHRQRQVRAAG
jgi:hypothetical protein